MAWATTADVSLYTGLNLPATPDPNHRDVTRLL